MSARQKSPKKAVLTEISKQKEKVERKAENITIEEDTLRLSCNLACENGRREVEKWLARKFKLEVEDESV